MFADNCFNKLVCNFHQADDSHFYNKPNDANKSAKSDTCKDAGERKIVFFALVVISL